MVGTKLYRRKSQVYRFLALYGILGVVGGALATLSVSLGRNVSGAAGFMIVFGFGMAIHTLIRSNRPQVSLNEDFAEVTQSRSARTLRYRNITGVSRPDARRMVVTLREDGKVRNEVIWLGELEPAEVERLAEFLAQAKGKGKGR